MFGLRSVSIETKLRLDLSEARQVRGIEQNLPAKVRVSPVRRSFRGLELAERRCRWRILVHLGSVSRIPRRSNVRSEFGRFDGSAEWKTEALGLSPRQRRASDLLVVSSVAEQARATSVTGDGGTRKGGLASGRIPRVVVHRLRRCRVGLHAITKSVSPLAV